MKKTLKSEAASKRKIDTTLYSLAQKTADLHIPYESHTVKKTNQSIIINHKNSLLTTNTGHGKEKKNQKENEKKILLFFLLFFMYFFFNMNLTLFLRNKFDTY